MKIETYVIAHNEEFMIPYLMRHYSRFSEVIILENNSTDKTVQVAKNLGAKVIKLKIPDNKDNQTLVDIKNECWKKSKADWVIVVDTDEFIYHPKIRTILKKTKATIMRTTWCEMYSDTVPSGDGQIYDEVNKGLIRSQGGGKIAIFRPDKIESINWTVGCHDASPIGNIIFADEGVKALHFRHLSLEYVLMRNRVNSARLSSYNRKMGWSTQYDSPIDHVTKAFTESLNQSIKIL